MCSSDLILSLRFRVRAKRSVDVGDGVREGSAERRGGISSSISSLRAKKTGKKTWWRWRGHVYCRCRKKLVSCESHIKGLVPAIVEQTQMALQMFSSFDASNVTFSSVYKNAKGGKAVYLNGPGNQKLIFQLPQLRAPFGLSEYKDEAKIGRAHV